MAIEDEFDGYFDTLSKIKDGDEPPADFGAPVDPNAPVVAPVADPVADPAAVVDPAAPVVEPVVAAPAPADNTELLSRLADLLDKRAPAAPAAPVAPAALAPLYTADEIAALTQFETDWPDVAKAFALMRRGDTVQNNAKLYSELGQVLGPQLANMQTVQVSHQLNELRRMIPDYDKVRDPVIAWAMDDKKQPAYLRTAYESVINNGDPAQITDMVTRWRTETGAPAAPASGQVVPPKTTAQVAAPSLAIQAAAAALAPVNSKRTTTVPAEPSTFDDAFKAFADLKD